MAQEELPVLKRNKDVNTKRFVDVVVVDVVIVVAVVVVITVCAILG